MHCDPAYDELTPAARAARTTYLLLMRAHAGQTISSREIAGETGLETAAGVRYLMANLQAAGLPVQRLSPGIWTMTMVTPDPGRDWRDWAECVLHGTDT